jgi:hypothetical protein
MNAKSCHTFNVLGIRRLIPDLTPAYLVLAAANDDATPHLSRVILYFF